MPILSVKNCSHTEYGAQRTVWEVKNLKEEQQSIPAGEDGHAVRHLRVSCWTRNLDAL